MSNNYGIAGVNLGPFDLSCKTQDRIPLNKQEATKVKKRKKNQSALGPEDEPKYMKKVKKERAKEAQKEEQEAQKEEQEGDTTEIQPNSQEII